ncbi:MAG: hypothetical protein CMB99_08410 [Flavobacteriaceae bacterium]|nr:hypothetical protein [Flavobacteriaceae bacterium]|tara:strand:+ start:68633 stop:69244 length:612 start_codon:yes stop_codon:yes gene_type:complete
MDILDNYKKAWENQPEENERVSVGEIYKMAHSRSSSIVKWIFIIGILEFVVFNSLYFFTDMEEAHRQYQELGLENFVLYTQIIAYAILFYFLVMFYLNYKNISTSDSTRVLMRKIIRTRRTVRNYVLFNLGYIALVMIVFTIASINVNMEDLNGKQIALLIGAMSIFTFLILGVMFLFYQLIYGILLRKLRRNYKELAKLEDE